MLGLARDVLADLEAGMIVAHVDISTVRLDRLARPICLSHVGTAHSTHAEQLGFMRASLLNDEANHIRMDYIAFFDPPLLDNAIDRAFEFSICSFVGPVFVI